jgi:2-dehydro-3-deoxyphosphooctonate aldolase (KDO 8-P synthase)
MSAASFCDRHLAPALARAATATGYLDGYFLEVHPNPKTAKSDAATVLSIPQADGLLRQLVSLWRESISFTELDRNLFSTR